MGLPEDGADERRKASEYYLTLILLKWRIGRAPNNSRNWQMGLHSAFKGLNSVTWLMKSVAFNIGLMKTEYYQHNARYVQHDDKRVTAVQPALPFMFRKGEGKFRTVNLACI